MATLEIEVPVGQKRRFKKFKDEFGEDALGYLIDRTKAADVLEMELQQSNSKEKKLEKDFEKLKEKYDELKQSTSIKQPELIPTKTDPSAVSVLTQALESMKQINESYARENERLLKITNFSEYDERIMALNRDIGSLKANLEGRSNSLKKANETISGLENKVREQGDDIRELNTFLEDARAQTENKKAELADAQDKISSRDESIARQRADIANKEAEIEELKKRFDLLQAEVSTMAVAQNGAKSEDQLHG